jgi:KDO2-lipid IV(A) lauroyltransferase
MRKSRKIKNLYINPKDDSPMAILDVVKVLRENEIVAMLGDRTESQKTMIFEFFGKETLFPIGVGMIAMATGAAVLPVFVVMEQSRKYRGIIEAPIYFESSTRGDRETVLRKGMESLIKKFEACIEKYPDQWYNFFSYWNQNKFTSPSPQRGEGWGEGASEEKHG